MFDANANHYLSIHQITLFIFNDKIIKYKMIHYVSIVQIVIMFENYISIVVNRTCVQLDSPFRSFETKFAKSCLYFSMDFQKHSNVNFKFSNSYSN